MNIHTSLSLFHVLFVAPLLLYVGIQGSKAPTWIFYLLGALAVGIGAYHGYRAFLKLSEGRSAWVNWIHLLLVVPIFAWIALQQKETPRRAFELVLMMGFATLGYHAYNLA